MPNIKLYYRLTKPGIIYGNALTVIAGFLLASRGHINLLLFLYTLVGICLVMASACVFNNYIDRDIDRRMTRTKQRALVTHEITGRNALIFATILGVAGFALLVFFVNLLTFLLGLVAMFMYVVVYGVAKRRSVHGTLVGAVPGALPPVAGYVAVTNNIDAGALLLFIIMILWQMPHFYAIAMYRRSDYAEAKLPVLPVKKGMSVTKNYIIWYVAAYLVASLLLTIMGYTGITYAVVMAVVGVIWFKKSLAGLRTTDDIRWARDIFKFSLIVLLVFSALLSVAVLLP